MANCFKCRRFENCKCSIYTALIFKEGDGKEWSEFCSYWKERDAQTSDNVQRHKECSVSGSRFIQAEKRFTEQTVCEICNKSLACFLIVNHECGPNCPYEKCPWKKLKPVKTSKSTCNDCKKTLR